MAVTKLNLESQDTQYKECHKMMCRNCNTRFCFKCLKILTDTFTCGCSIDLHGFVDPRTGKRLEHLRPAQKEPPTTPATPTARRQPAAKRAAARGAGANPRGGG